MQPESSSDARAPVVQQPVLDPAPGLLGAFEATIGTPGAQPDDLDDISDTLPTRMDTPGAAASTQQPSQPGTIDQEQMVKMVSDMMTVMDELKKEMKALREENKHLKKTLAENLKKKEDEQSVAEETSDDEGDKAKVQDAKPLQDIDRKDVDKPTKYKGDPLQWRKWSMKFMAFLGRRDKRWPDFIKAIQAVSDTPLGAEDEEKIFKKLGIDMTMEEGKKLALKFKEQFEEYLENFTEGPPHTMIQAAGVNKVMETFRILCDEGHSKRHRHLKKEYRVVTNPKQASFDTLRQAIASWETDLAIYDHAAGSQIDDRTRLLCLEDICPDLLQQHLASKDNLKDYAAYKAVINDYLIDRKRWVSPNNKGKINWLGLQESVDDDPVGAEETENLDNNDDSVEGIMNEVKATLMALVKSKFQKGPGGKGGKLGKGGKFGKGGKGGDKPDGKAMDVDEPRCFECNEPMAKCGHSARDCPVRKARVAAGGPERLPKGAGKGTSKGGKGGWPSKQMWSNFYPGPTQAQWRGWYPQYPQQPAAGPPTGKLNLFEQPHQLSNVSPLQSLLTTLGTCYSIKPRDKVKDEKPKSFAHQNKFAALEREESPGCEKSLTVNLMDAVKKPSRNRQRKTAIQETAPMQTNSATIRPRPRTSELPINKSAMNDNGTILEAMLKFVNNPMKGDSPTAAPAKVVSADSVASLPEEGRPAYRRTTGDDADSGVEYNRSTGTSSIHKICPTGVQDFQTAVSGTSPMVDFVNENGKVTTNKKYAKDKNDADAEKDVLKVLNPTTRNQSLKQVTQRKTVPSLGGEFEVLSSVVDSGATVPVMHPEDAADYELLESQASRDGVEYEVANLETIPNLGEKKFAILTAEGTLRGYQTQCAETAKGKPLQAVRALVGSRHAVCFGLGENDNEHLIINKISGEVNRMRDDGINYLQDMLVVPQNRIEQVQQHLWSIQQRANDQDQDFTWQG